MEGEKGAVRLTETEEELKKNQVDNTLKYYCQLCYILLKNNAKGIKIEEKTIVHKSVPKNESVKSSFQDTNTNIFSKYDRLNWTDKKEPTKDVVSPVSDKYYWRSAL